MQFAYPCVLAPEVGGGYSVFFPDLPEAITCGDNRAEALQMAEDALVAALGAYIHCKEDIPIPSSATEGQALVAVPPVLAAKSALHMAMRRKGLTRVALARRLGISESAVRKLLNPGHRSHIGQIEKALRTIGRGLVIRDRAA